MLNWSILDITYTDYPTEVTVVATTNTPVTLTMYITDVPPVRHKDSRVIRGLAGPWGAYFCLVSLNTIPQLEPTDSLIHTFNVPDWLYCQWRYFIFKGTVGGVESPSISPIFLHHNPIPPYTKYEHYETGDTSYFISTNPPNWLGQSFTPQLDHEIRRLVLKLGRRNDPGIVTVSIRACAWDHKPLLPDLSLVSFPASDLPSFGLKQWFTIDIPPYPLDAFNIYSIIARASAPDTNNWLTWRIDFSGNYPNGLLLATTNAGATWSTWPSQDLIFQEWGIPR